MRYYETDFFRWEQAKIDQLRNEGKYVYHLIDFEGDTFIGYGRINRFGFLITDEPLDVGDDYMKYEKFLALDGLVMDPSLLETETDISEELKKAKEAYEIKTVERENEIRALVEQLGSQI